MNQFDEHYEDDDILNDVPDEEHIDFTAPLEEQTLDDFDEFFRSCPGMTFIFITPEEIDTVYPDVRTASQMFLCLLQGSHFEPAFENKPPLISGNSPSHQELVSEIEARVEEMYRRDEPYRLIWHLAGDPEVYVDSSDMDYIDDVAWLLIAESQVLSRP